MKKYAAFFVLALAIGSGVAAVYLANRWMTSRESQAPLVVKETVPLTSVVIAAMDLEVGTRLTKENLALAQWPKSMMPRGSFTSIELTTSTGRPARSAATSHTCARWLRFFDEPAPRA